MIKIQGLTRTFQLPRATLTALDNVSLEIREGEFFVLLGPSGSGKTTLLRSIAGLERPSEGEISINGSPVFSSAPPLFVLPEHRRLGMVFQSYAIWPHLSVYENVALPLTSGMHRCPSQEVRQRVTESLAAVQMEHHESRGITQLSGGQQQRVALARALAVQPQALLMDEPLSNLDARLREEIRSELKSIVRKFGMTVVYVTHDQSEAMALGDRVAVMNKGCVLQIGEPRQLYRHPATPRVAEFFGSINWIGGRAQNRSEIAVGDLVLAVEHGFEPGPVQIGARPEDVSFDVATRNSGDGLDAQLIEVTDYGDHCLCTLSLRDGTKLVAKTTSTASFDNLPKSVKVYLRPEKLHIYEAGNRDGAAP